jgi:DNA repair exonuclease SbcCD ATPase subunit
VEAVSRVFGDAERGQIMLDFAEVALEEIESQRSELIEPLNQQEQEVLAHLAESYDQLQQAQAQLTAYLASARNVRRSQDEILQSMGVLEQRDEALERAVRLSEALSAAARGGRSAAEALERMKAIIEASGLDGQEG